MIGHRNVSIAVVMLLLFGGVSAGSAAEEDTRTVEWYIDQARPLLHHSCQSAWDAVEQDEDRFVEMVGTISAVSFVNHDFDVERLTALPEDKRKQLQREFYEDIGRHCSENNEALLAGVIDQSLTAAIDKVAAEEQQQQEARDD